MFDIGFLELLIIGVVALLVLGPERLPKAARTAGLWIGKIKRTVSGMQRDISAQLEAEELRQKLDEQQKKLDASLNQVKQDVERYAEPDPVEAADATPDKATADTPTPDKASGQPTDDQARLDAALAQRRDEASVASEAHREASAASDKDQSPR